MGRAVEAKAIEIIGGLRHLLSSDQKIEKQTDLLVFWLLVNKPICYFNASWQKINITDLPRAVLVPEAILRPKVLTYSEAV